MFVKKRFLLQLALFIAVVALVSLSLQAQTFETIKSQVKVHVLKNGMKFIVLERHEAPVVSFHVYADVGSANESYGITGISHLLEHMAFKGTKIVGTKDYKAEAKILEEMDALYDQIKREEAKAKTNSEKIKEMEEKFETLRKNAKEYVATDEFVDMLMKEGDRGINAYTSTDATQYINSLPSNKLEYWMSMTSDRFLNPIFREFFKERDVVMEERRLGLETRPMGKLVEDFTAAAFKAHPYHHSVVGHMSDLEKITRKDVGDYFKKFYGPNNLTVGIVGDVKTEEVFKLAEIYFSRIPSGPKPEAVRTIEPEQWGERRVIVEAKSQPIVIMGYHCPDARHKDIRSLEAMANIIGQGRSSRLYEVLVKDKKVAVAAVSVSGFPGDKFSNLVVFYAVPSRGHTSAECLELIDEEIEKIKKESVTPEELTKFKRGEVKGILDQMKSNSRMAALLTYTDVVLGDWKLMFDQIEEIRAITAEDIKRVANKYLVKKHKTIGEIVYEK
ncbi:MAG: insulinase family protein [Candidatus Aminicenantes bacterium]|nr:insulinase family protein [Candidatus Aminicenantes bacterium]MBL7082241.1 insulinase family protein [Candidatus Aminicenantes bacterium]